MATIHAAPWRPWPHGPPWLPLAARTAAPSLRVSPPPWHLQAHRVSLAGGRREPRQQGCHSRCSRRHHGDGTSDLGKRGWPLESGASHCPLRSLCSGEGDWGQLCWAGTLPHGGCLRRAARRVCPHAAPEPTRPSALLSGSQHQGWESGRSCDRPSLPVSGEGGTWCHQPGRGVGREAGRAAALQAGAGWGWSHRTPSRVPSTLG